MLDLRRTTAAPLLCLLACTSPGEPGLADDGLVAASAAPRPATIRPRPPRPAILGATVPPASTDPDSPFDVLCDDRPAVLELVPLDPDAHRTLGRTVVRDGDGWAGLPLRETRYDAVVVGTTAQTSVVQVFHNPLPGPVDATYRFPLAPGAAIDGYWIRLVDHELHGVMQRVADAHPRGLSAAPGPRRVNQFSQTIADIPPGATFEVELRVVQPLRHKGGRHRLTLPMEIGARDPDAARTSCSPIDVQVTIEAGAQVSDLRAQHHTLTVETTRDQARLELTRGVARPDRDLDLSWQLAGPEPRAQLLAESTDDGGFFTLTIDPLHAPARPRALVFVLDTSTAMRGPPLGAAADVIRRALVTMGPDDTFEIVPLTAGGRRFAATPLRSTPAVVARAVGFLTRLAGEGDRKTLAAVTAALARKPDPERLRIVVFLGDGRLGDDAALAELARRRGDARLFSVGLTSESDRFVLDGIARIGRGAALYFDPDRPSRIVEELQHHIGAPVWTDLEIDWGRLAVVDVVPAALPDLAGQPVVVHGRFTGALAGAVILKGKRGDTTLEVPVQLALREAATPSGLRATWARRHIDVLLGYPNSATAMPDAQTIAAVTELAIAHRVTTPYTGLVTVDTRTGEPVPPPGPSPDDDPPVAGSHLGRGGSGMFGVPIRVPSVRQARADVTGALDTSILRRVVRAHINEVRRCYDIGLARDRNLKGRIAVKFEIDAAGHVRAAEVEQDTIPDRIVAPCITAAVRRWRFPKPEGGGLVTVVYPFVFEPG